MDIGGLLDGGTEVEQVLRFWVGATSTRRSRSTLMAVRRRGYQRFNDRSPRGRAAHRLDPRRPDDPLILEPSTRGDRVRGAGGGWSTPALYGDVVFFSTRGWASARGQSGHEDRAARAAGRGSIDRITRRRRRRADPGGLPRRPVRVGRHRSVDRAAAAVEDAVRGASNRRLRCGGGGSTSARAGNACTASPTPTGRELASLRLRRTRGSRLVPPL